MNDVASSSARHWCQCTQRALPSKKIIIAPEPPHHHEQYAGPQKRLLPGASRAVRQQRPLVRLKTKRTANRTSGTRRRGWRTRTRTERPPWAGLANPNSNPNTAQGGVGEPELEPPQHRRRAKAVRAGRQARGAVHMYVAWPPLLRDAHFGGGASRCFRIQGKRTNRNEWI